jgi:hypothetical protein
VRAAPDCLAQLPARDAASRAITALSLICLASASATTTSSAAACSSSDIALEKLRGGESWCQSVLSPSLLSFSHLFPSLLSPVNALSLLWLPVVRCAVPPCEAPVQKDCSACRCADAGTEHLSQVTITGPLASQPPIMCAPPPRTCSSYQPPQPPLMVMSSYARDKPLRGDLHGLVHSSEFAPER